MHKSTSKNIGLSIICTIAQQAFDMDEGGVASKLVFVGIGVPEGGSVSPLYFGVVINEVILEINGFAEAVQCS